MLIPLNMLWKIQISVRQKFGLLCVFCSTVFVMIVAIIRVAVIRQRGQYDLTWVYTWTNVEQITGKRRQWKKRISLESLFVPLTNFL